MIYTVTLNPALDKTVVVERFAVDAVNRIRSVRMDPGGKGINVSKVIARMGGASVAMGLLGGQTGNAIRESLEAMGIPMDVIGISAETRTNIKIVDPVLGQNTDLNEPGPRVESDVAQQLLRRLLGRLVPGDIVVLAGSLPEGLPPDTYGQWITPCKAAGARVFLDADGMAFAAGAQAGPDLVKPNAKELSGWAGRPLTDMKALIDAAQALCNRGIANVVVSMGAQGMLFVRQDGAVYAPGIPIRVSSTVGAGDSVVAALVLAMDRGMTPEQAMRLAVATGTANAMSDGTQAADRAAVEAICPRVKLVPLLEGGMLRV